MGRNSSITLTFTFLAAYFTFGVSPQISLAGTLEQPAQRSVNFRYGAVKTRKFVEKQNAEKRKRSLETMADTLSASLRLPSPIVLVREECGESQAFYNRRTRELTLCYELDDEVNRRVTKKFGKTQQAKLIGAGAILFVLYHEVGHVEIDLYNIPITGREEDVADQLATYELLAMQPDMSLALIEGAMWFFSETSLSYTRQHLADVHSLQTQRQFNILCWAYGKDQAFFSALAKRFSLPVKRALGCQREYAQLAEAVNVMRLHEKKQNPDAQTTEYVDKREIDQAVRHFTEEIWRDPKDAGAYTKRGVAFLRRGIAYGQRSDYDQAIQDFTEAIRLNPRNGDAYINRGIGFVRKGDYDRGIQDFTEVIRVDPKSADAYRKRGSAYTLKKDYDQAIQDFTEAIRIDPNDATAYRYRSSVYDLKGDHNRAVQDQNEAIRIETRVTQ